MSPNIPDGLRDIYEKVEVGERLYWLFSLDLVLIGRSEQASGVEAWLSGEVQQAGDVVDVSVRIGTEAEFWPNVMRGRIGAYYEPSRFEETSGRFHGTVSLDIRLFELIWIWRFTTGVDFSSDYLNTMFSLGFWH